MGAGERTTPAFASLEASAPPPSGPREGTTGLGPDDTGPPGTPAWPRPAGPPPDQPDLRSLPVGSRIDAALLVLEIEPRGGDTPHTILTFGNATGRIASAPFWASEAHRLATIAPLAVVHVAGTIGAWRDRRQLTVESMRPLPDTVPETLLPSIGDPAPWWRLIDTWRGSLQAVRLAGILGLVFDDLGLRERFARCPASAAGHHAKLGGLLQHTCEVAHVAMSTASLFPTADRELLLAGALLHDLGKVESYDCRSGPTLTPAGRAIGHVVQGCLLLDRLVHAAPAPPCTPFELELLYHLILSHHGQRELGAPVLPLTLEAELLHLADQVSAKGSSLADALADPTLFAGEDPVSARPIWQLDRRRVWRGRSDWGRIARLDPAGRG